MSDTTDNIYAQYTPPSSGDFFTFEDGKESRIRIASEPFVYLDSFTDKKTGETTNSTKYAWAIYNQTAKAAQILRLPITAYRLLASIANDEDYGDPTKRDIKIKRTGMGTNTNYSIIAVPTPTELTDEQLAAVDKVDVQGAIKNAVPMRQVVGGAKLPEPVVRAASEADGPSPADREANAPAPARNQSAETIDLDSIPF